MLRLRTVVRDEMGLVEEVLMKALCAFVFASACLIGGHAQAQDGSWSFDRYEEEGDSVCLSSIKQGGLEVGLFRYPGGPIKAFISSPIANLDQAPTTWSVDGVYSLPMQGERDDLNGWIIFETIDGDFVDVLQKGNSLNIKETENARFSLINAKSSIQQLLDCEADLSVSLDEAGTPFRGVGLGLSYDQVEAAIEPLGLRCIDSEDATTLNTAAAAGHAGEVHLDRSRCVFVSKDFEFKPDDPTSGLILFFSLSLEFSGFSVVHFLDDKAEVIYLNSNFFNADKMKSIDFAQAIANNYNIELNNSTLGWTGFSSRGEEVSVVNDLTSPYLKVSRANAVPTFD